MLAKKGLSRIVRITLALVFIVMAPLSFSEAFTLRIDQPKVRLTIPPNGAKSGKIFVENPASEEKEVKVYLEDWTYSIAGDGSKVFYPPDTTELSCAPWITFVPAEFNLLPFAKQTVNYTVKVPGEAAGGHYAVMFFEIALGEMAAEEGANVAILGRLGSLFCIEPEGTIKRGAKLENLTVTKDQDLSIKLDFTNTGNVDIAPEGTFYIMDQKGIVVARGKFERAYTLPQDKVVISSSIPEENVVQIPPGEYDLIVTIDLGEIPEVLERKLRISPSGEISTFSPD